VEGAETETFVEGAPLGEVADVSVRVPRLSSEDVQLTGRQWDEPEQRLDERRLSDTVGSEDGNELPTSDVEVDMGPDRATADSHSAVAHHHCRSVHDGPSLPRLAQFRIRRGSNRCRGVHRPVARASAVTSCCSWSACQSWNATFSGGVSVTVATSIPLARAASTRVCTSGVAFWLLNTNTPICLPVICPSAVALSCAVG